MKKFELGKVYQQMNRDGSIRAEFTPLFIGEEKAFGTWQTIVTPTYPPSEHAIEHHLLEKEDDRLHPRYREKPPEPESIELFVNIYKSKTTGKLWNGGVHLTEAGCVKGRGINTSDFLGVAHIKFTEGDG